MSSLRTRPRVLHDVLPGSLVAPVPKADGAGEGNEQPEDPLRWLDFVQLPILIAARNAAIPDKGLPETYITNVTNLVL